MTKHRCAACGLTITGIGVFTDEVVQDDIDRIYRILATPRAHQAGTALLCRLPGPACGWPAATAMWSRCSGSSAGYFRRGLRKCSGSRRSSKARESGRSGPDVRRRRRVRPDRGAHLRCGWPCRRSAARLLAAMDARGILRAVGASPFATYPRRFHRRRLRDRHRSDAGHGGGGSCFAAGSIGAVCTGLNRIHGVSFDWTVLGAGAAFFLLALSGATAVLARAEVSARSPAARRGCPLAERGGDEGAADPAGHSSHRDRSGVRARAWRPLAARAGPSISGTVVALIVLVGSLVFGASLSNLVSHPALVRLDLGQGAPRWQRLRQHPAAAGTPALRA